MNLLRTFFELEANRVVLNFGHGLIFFLMGFGVLIKSKRWSELTLAKALPWLGAFGILNALGDWGLVFLPIQTSVFSERAMAVLWLLDTVLLALSYAFLLMFAFKLLAETKSELAWLPRLVWVLFGLWLAAFLSCWWVQKGPSFEQGPGLYRTFEALYRYGFALSGSLFGAWALSLQREELERLGLEASIPPLMWVGYSLTFHAVAAGLIVPEGGFFPANILNSWLVFEATGIPIRLWTGVSGAIVAFFILDSLDVFDAEFQRRIDDANRQRAIMGERLRIARDLHDGIIQTLYAVGLSLEGLILSRGQEQTGEDEIRSIMRSVDGAIKDVRKYIMRLKAPTQEASLDEQLHLFVREIQRESRVPVRIKTEPVEGGVISAEAILDVLLIVREAVSNAVRHARASEIHITLVRDDRGINLSIVDDGIGFDPDLRPQAAAGEHLGLDNMRRRADSVGGHLSIHSEPGHGTEILLRIPLHP